MLELPFRIFLLRPYYRLKE